jgi:hypothetical protein
MMGPMKTVYPLTRNLEDWLNAELWPIEQAVFRFWQDKKHLVRMTRQEDLHPFAMQAAIRQYNEETGESVTEEELNSLCSDYTFCDAGEWALYTENQVAILFGDGDEPDSAFYGAAEHVKWAILILPCDGQAIVYRSPCLGHREALSEDELLAEGLVIGDAPSFVLPPEIEGAVIQDLQNQSQ